MYLWKLCLPSTKSGIWMIVMMLGTSSKIYLQKLFPPRSLGISSNPSGWKTLQASKRLSSRHLQLFHNYALSLSQKKMSRFLFSSIPKHINDNHRSILTSLLHLTRLHHCRTTIEIDHNTMMILVIQIMPMMTTTGQYWSIGDPCDEITRRLNKAINWLNRRKPPECLNNDATLDSDIKHQHVHIF